MKKYLATFIGGIAVLVLTLIPLVTPPEELPWMRWKVTVWISGAVAAIALLLQAKWDHDGDEEQERRERERDAVLQKIAEAVLGPKQRRHFELHETAPSEQAASLALSLLTLIDASSNKSFSVFEPSLRQQLQEIKNLFPGLYFRYQYGNVSRDDIRKLAEELLIWAINQRGQLAFT